MRRMRRSPLKRLAAISNCAVHGVCVFTLFSLISGSRRYCIT